MSDIKVSKIVPAKLLESECEGCKHAKVNTVSNGWECRRYPPTVTPMIAGRAKDTGEILLAGTISVFPMATVACGEYAPAIAIVSRKPS